MGLFIFADSILQKTLLKTLFGSSLKKPAVGLAFLYRIEGKVPFPKFQFYIAFLSYLTRHGHSIRIVFKSLGHLLGRSKVELIRGEAHPVGIIYCLVSLYTQQDIMGLGILRGQVVTIICGNYREPQFFTKIHQSMVYYCLLGYIIFLYFQIETVVKYACIGLCKGLCLFPVSMENGSRNLTVETGRERYKTLI